MAQDQISGYLLTQDVEHMLGVSRRMVYEYTKTGRLHPKKIGHTLLFDPAEVAKLKTERKSWTHGGKREKRAK